MPIDPPSIDRLFRSFFGQGFNDDDDSNEQDRLNNDRDGLHPLSQELQREFIRRGGGGFGGDPFGGGGMHSWSRSASYSMRQDNNETQIQVQLPGMSSKDITVEVTKPDEDYEDMYVPPSMACTVDITAGGSQQQQQVAEPLSLKPTPRPSHELSAAQRQQQEQQHYEPPQFQQRFKLGPSVNCNEIAAHLSRGILTITAPKKQQYELEKAKPKLSTRVIDIEE